MSDLPVPASDRLCWTAPLTPRQGVLYGLGALGMLIASFWIGLRLANDQNDFEQKAVTQATVKPTTDFGVFFHAGERFRRGEPLYRAGVKPAPAGHRPNCGDAAMGFKYGPLFALLFTPFSLLPNQIAAASWTFCNLLAILGMGAILGRWLRRYFRLRPAGADRPALHPPAWWGYVALMAAFFFLQLNVVYGQTNLVFMLLLMWGLERFAAGRKLEGGLWVGVVAGMRLTPLVFLPYFLWKRQWRAGLGMALGLGVSFALPLLRWGPQEFGRQMQDWRELVVADEALDSDALTDAAGARRPTDLVSTTPAAAGDAVAEEAYYLRPVRYQSIPPMVLDTFARDYAPKAGETAHFLQGKRNFMKGMLDRHHATLLAYGLAGLFCLACAVLCWRPVSADELRQPLEWALVLTAMLLVSPYTERTHFAALVPALALVTGRALVAWQRWRPVGTTPATSGPASERGRPVVWAVVMFVLFNVLNQTFMPRVAYEWFKGFHGYVFGAIGLFVLLAVWIVRELRAAGVGKAAVPAPESGSWSSADQNTARKPS